MAHRINLCTDIARRWVRRLQGGGELPERRKLWWVAVQRRRRNGMLAWVWADDRFLTWIETAAFVARLPYPDHCIRVYFGGGADPRRVK